LLQFGFDSHTSIQTGHFSAMIHSAVPEWLPQPWGGLCNILMGLLHHGKIIWRGKLEESLAVETPRRVVKSDGMAAKE
jgi:hypothetical protein